MLIFWQICALFLAWDLNVQATKQNEFNDARMNKVTGGGERKGS
jgi:hypothetical protein